MKHLGLALAQTAGDAPATPAAAASELPRPQAVLPKRPGEATHSALTPAQLFKEVERSVFVVLATPTAADARSRNIAQGSAVAVSDHLLLTNCHVVLGRPLIKIVQEQTTDDATLVAADPAADRCVIKSAALTLVPVAGISPFDGL